MNSDRHRESGESQSAVARVFISYSHKDEQWKDRMVTHLGVLAREKRLEIWDDRRIGGGDDWLPEIQSAIESCDVALLLVSVDFLNSDFILEKEVPRLLERRIKEGICVIPVIVRPCVWDQVSWLKGIQARPKDGKALSSMSESLYEEALTALTKEVFKLLGQTPAQPVAVTGSVLPYKLDLAKLPQTGHEFLGREQEMRLLHDAWDDTANAHIVELVAPGGTGKTALVKHWLEQLKKDNWRNARRVYGYSFYSQGTREDRQASEDHFLNDALKWFEVEHDPAMAAADKGKLLAAELVRERTLLILDGVEPLQYPPGPMAGRLRAPGLQAILQHLARAGHAGLCVLTTRERIEDLQEHCRSKDYPDRAMAVLELSNLAEADGARLLHRLGVKRAGKSEIKDDDKELRAASREVRGHALALTLLGRYLSLSSAGGVGDIRKRDLVRLDKANQKIQGGHAFKVMEAYERWFERPGGDSGALALVRLLGLFDRPATAGCLKALRQPPVIKGLTESLIELSDEDWNIAVSFLARCGLVSTESSGEILDAHPLVREYFAAVLQKQNESGWREGHKRLYDYLKDSVEYHPEGIDGLQPLYQAVSHGCLARLHQEACEEVYGARIMRGTKAGGFYSTNILGAIGADLGAVACFFEQPWKRLSPNLGEPAQAWLLNEAAFSLRALGRLTEALEPMRAGLEMIIAQENWRAAARVSSNLSGLELTLGEFDKAILDSEQSITFADRSEDAFSRMAFRTTHADALYQTGKRERALALFKEAEAIQVEFQPDYPFLYSLWGFRYCDLLLARAERVAWARVLEKKSKSENAQELLDACRDVAERAAKTLKLATLQNWLLDIALDNLTLGRTALFRAILEGSSFDPCQTPIVAAVSGLRAAGQQDYLTLGLLTRAWLGFMQGNIANAKADLDEAQDTAERGSMKLHLADIHLYRARLFKDKSELEKAQALIKSCNYARRNQELQDAQTASKDW